MPFSTTSIIVNAPSNQEGFFAIFALLIVVIIITKIIMGIKE